MGDFLPQIHHTLSKFTIAIFVTFLFNSPAFPLFYHFLIQPDLEWIKSYDDVQFNVNGIHQYLQSGNAILASFGPGSWL